MTLRRGLRGGLAGVMGLALAACAVPSPNAGPAANASRPKASAAPEGGAVVAQPSPAVVGSVGSSQLGAPKGAGRLFLPLRFTPNLPAALLGNDGASLLANDGASAVAGASGLIANDGAALIANDGVGLIANDGGSLIANDGAGLIGNDGAGLIGNDGAGVVAAGAGNYRLAQAQGDTQASMGVVLRSIQSKVWAQSATSFLVDQLMLGWAMRQPRLGKWTRFSAQAQLLPMPGTQGMAPGLLSGFAKKEPSHFATYWRMEGQVMAATTVLLPSADAPLSEGSPIIDVRTDTPGDISMRGVGLERVSNLPSLLAIKGFSVLARIQFLPKGARSTELLVAQESGQLDPLFPKFTQVPQECSIWMKARYELDGQGGLGSRFSEQTLQRPFALTIPAYGNRAIALTNVVAAQSSRLGLAGWLRFGDQVDATAPTNRMAMPARAVYGDASGALVLSPSEGLKAMMPNDDFASDASFHPPTPALTEDVTQDARFRLPVLGASDWAAGEGDAP